MAFALMASWNFVKLVYDGSVVAVEIFGMSSGFVWNIAMTCCCSGVADMVLVSSAVLDGTVVKVRDTLAARNG